MATTDEQMMALASRMASQIKTPGTSMNTMVKQTLGRPVTNAVAMPNYAQVCIELGDESVYLNVVVVD